MRGPIKWAILATFLWARTSPASWQSSESLARKLVREAQELLSSRGLQELAEARKKYESAIALWREAGPNVEEAHAAIELAELLKQAGDVGAAQEKYEEALRSSRAVGVPEVEAQAVTSLSALHLRAGRNALALDFGRRAEEAALRAGNDRLLADALFQQGYAQTSLGRMREAVRLFEASAAAAGRVWGRAAKSRALVQLGFAAMAIDANARAREAIDEALLLLGESDELTIRADALRAMGQLHKRRGEMQKALEYYERSRALVTSADDRSARATLSNAMGQVYFDMGEPATALRYYEEALAIGRSEAFRLLEAVSLSETARCYSEVGADDVALRRFQQAVVIYREVGNSRLEADLLGEMGRLQGRAGKLESALVLFAEAIALKDSSGDAREKAYLLNDAAAVHRKLRDYQKALHSLVDALALSRSAEDPVGESLGLFNMALVHRDMGSLTQSREEIESSIQIVEKMRSNVASHDLRTSFFATMQRRYSFYIDLLLQLHEEDKTRGFDRDAFSVSERGRARTLLEGLAESTEGAYRSASPELRDREGFLRTALNERARQQELLTDDPVSAKHLSDEIRELTLEHDLLRARILSGNSRYAALANLRSETVEDVQGRLLDRDTRLLAYVLGEEKTFLFSMTPTQYSVHELPPAREIESRSINAYRLLTTRQRLGASSPNEVRDLTSQADRELGAVLQDLSDILLGPVEGLRETARLAVVSDGALSYLPFAALPLPRGQSGERSTGTPLVAEFEIVRLPSATALAMLRKQSDPREFETAVVVVADPVYAPDDPRVISVPAVGDRESSDAGHVPRLRFSRREAQEILKLAPEGGGIVAMDFEASADWIRNADFRGARVLHFAAHGSINNAYPNLSGIALSMVDGAGRTRDGFLRLHDIQNLTLPVELVVLSACDTALGKRVSGEGLLGMVRGFMYAGAPRVIASLWKVDDEATVELMVRFYRNLFVRRLTPAASLRAAQLSMLEATSWTAPFFWAAFELQGEWN